MAKAIKNSGWIKPKSESYGVCNGDRKARFRVDGARIAAAMGVSVRKGASVAVPVEVALASTSKPAGNIGVALRALRHATTGTARLCLSRSPKGVEARVEVPVRRGRVVR